MNTRQIKFKTDEGIPPFLNIEKACEVTGLSQFWLRTKAKSGEIPCLKSGRVYLINVPALLRQLDQESGAV